MCHMEDDKVIKKEIKKGTGHWCGDLLSFIWNCILVCSCGLCLLALLLMGWTTDQIRSIYAKKVKKINRN